jgi:hypothetical protein
MEAKLIRVLVALGVPGVALGIFYLLLRSFSFQFSEISPGWTTLIVVLFLVIVGAITAYALHLWQPTKSSPADPASHAEDRFVFNGGEEIVTFRELLRSREHDVVKINAHSHTVGVAAEYRWLGEKYPGFQMIRQALTAFQMRGREIHFDVITIRLGDKRQKEVYFDISSFFGGGGSTLIDPQAFIARKMEEIYDRE